MNLVDIENRKRIWEKEGKYYMHFLERQIPVLINETRRKIVEDNVSNLEYESYKTTITLETFLKSDYDFLKKNQAFINGATVLLKNKNGEDYYKIDFFSWDLDGSYEITLDNYEDNRNV